MDGRGTLAVVFVLALQVTGCVTAGPVADPSPATQESSPARSATPEPGRTPSPTEPAPASPPPQPSAPQLSPEAPVRSLLPDEIPLPTSPPGEHFGDALIENARLGGDPYLNGGCLWLESAQDPPGGVSPGTRTSAIWRYGFRAFRDPLRLVGPDGQVVARVGDILSLGGGSPPVDFVVPPELDPCGTGQVFAVSEVVSVNGVVVRIGAPPSPQP